MAKKKDKKSTKKIIHHDKKKIILKGATFHFFGYIILGLFLNLLGIPPMITFIVIMVLLWGLFVMCYAYYYHK